MYFKLPAILLFSSLLKLIVFYKDFNRLAVKVMIE